MIRSLLPRLLALFASIALSGEALAVAGPKIVFMIGEDEYKTWETLPEFAKTDLAPQGAEPVIIHSDKKEKHQFPGIVEALRGADLLVISVRRRIPPKEQLDAVRSFIAQGKPVIGIRTASHAFAAKKDTEIKGDAQPWQTFDPEILGGHYTGHHGAGPLTTVAIAPGAEKHAILKDVNLSALIGNGSLYKVSPLAGDAAPILIGTIAGQPAEPIAWTRTTASGSRVFYTSLGDEKDFQQPAFRTLLRNAIGWAVGKPLGR